MRPRALIAPSSGAGAGAPSPRNDRLDKREHEVADVEARGDERRGDRAGQQMARRMRRKPADAREARRFQVWSGRERA